MTVQEQMFFLHWKTRDGPDEKASFLLHWGRTQILTQKQSRPEMTAIIKTNHNVHVASVHIIIKKKNIGLHDLSSKENFAHHICSTSKTAFLKLFCFKHFISSKPQMNLFPMKNTKSHQVPPQKVMD